MVEVDRGIINPKEFLVKPSQKLEVGTLAEAPNIKLLRYLPTLKNYSALYLIDSKWHVIKTNSELGIPDWLLPQGSAVLMYSRPSNKADTQGEEAVPSINDFLLCSPFAKNLIVSSSGITQYWSVGVGTKRVLARELNADHFRFADRKRFKEYISFLKDNGAEYKVHPWDKITEQNLPELLHR